MEDLKITFMDVKDVEEASKLITENYGSSNNFVVDMYTVESFKPRLEAKMEKAYVAKIKNKIVGLISFFQAGQVATVTLVIVNKEFQFKGIGTKLLNTVLDELKDVTKFIFNTEHTNRKSMSMAVKCGFVPEGFIHHGYAQNNHMVSWGLFRGEIPTP